MVAALRLLGTFVIIGLLAACGDDAEAGSGGTGAVAGTFGGTGAVGGVGGSNYCAGVTRECDCPDGSKSTQGCNNGPPPSLLPCDCTVGGAGGDGGGSGGALCDRLAGMSGCQAETFVSPKLPASILFVVDRSGSMLCNPPPEQTTAECDTGPLAAMTKTTTMPTKWDLTVDALKSAFTSLAAAGGAKAGLKLFSNDGQCGVGLAPSVNIQDLDTSQAQAMSNALDAVDPSGATPIVGSVLLAYQHVHWEAGTTGCTTPPCGAPGNRFVILMTDGADTCSMASDRLALLTTEVQKARMANIRTFVIGSPGSEPARGFLSALAYEGGTARDEANCLHPSDIEGSVGNCHFDLASSTNLAADLQIALGDISGAALTCEFTVPGAPLPDEAAADVNVQYTLGGATTPLCVSKLPDTTPCDTQTDGWTFAKNSDGTSDLSKVILCGPACTTVKADLTAQVDVIRGCNVLE